MPGEPGWSRMPLSKISMTYVTKGTRVRYRFFAKHDCSLSGAQMKVGAVLHDGVGTVTHVYGDHPTSPSQVTVTVKPDAGGDEIEVPSTGIISVIPPAGY